MREVSLSDPRHPHDKTLLLYTEGGPDDWGELEPLRETSWKAGVRVVSAEALGHALHGYLLPLLRELGSGPHRLARRVEGDEGICKMAGTCLDYTQGYCRPGGRRKQELGPPGCWDPPVEDGTPLEMISLLQRVAQAWKEGRHVLVVRGKMFNVA